MTSYPNPHACPRPAETGALIADVLPQSPADDAGFYPGCVITRVNGEPLTDILAWQWLSADDFLSLEYIDGDGDEGLVELERLEEEQWGFVFEGTIFDGVRNCRNACTFCFMRQLPKGLRPSLSLRDDDYRLSFLDGTFVTLTNVTEEDERRIISQRLSPLRLSLHAINPQVRSSLIGRNAQHGLDVLGRLLDAGIEFCAQIVLVPGVNDGQALRETIEWCYGQPGILEVGIVPLGFTRYQGRFDKSFDSPQDAREVLDLVRPYQERALADRNRPWVYAADEFYLNAYGPESIEKIPDAGFYGDFEMFEDGVGIARSFIDDFHYAQSSGLLGHCADALSGLGKKAYLLVGEAPMAYSPRLFGESPLAESVELVPVKNAFFGGNVDVTGLLCGVDMVQALRNLDPDPSSTLLCVPSVVFNDDGCTLDGYTLRDMENQVGLGIAVVPDDAIGLVNALMGLCEPGGR